MKNNEHKYKNINKSWYQIIKIIYINSATELTHIDLAKTTPTPVMTTVTSTSTSRSYGVLL